MEERIPQAIWSGELTICGVTLHCHVLADHRRIIDADDVAAFFAAMERPDFLFTKEDAERLAGFIKGKDRP